MNAHSANPPLQWELGYHDQKTNNPQEWMPATVPGAVQLDYAKAKGWEPWSYGENWQDYRWMEDVYWTYKTHFSKPELKGNERYFFVSKGIDYQFEVLLNGQVLLKQEGMFRPVELDITDHLQEENTLSVLIYPVPKVPGRPDDRTQAAESVKPAVSYLWDWHPRLIPSGIWDDTRLDIRKEAYFKDVYLHYILSNDFSRAEINLAVEGVKLKGKQYKWELTDPTGKVVLKKWGEICDLKNDTFILDHPMLWWTHDHGTPTIYSSTFQLLDANHQVLDETLQKTGFRRIRLVMHEGAWSQPDSFPKGRSNPPITIELNGRQIFSKGSNWVNPEIFPGIITKESYEGLLDNALNAHFNLLRVWGGGIVNKEAFYDVCDEKGILVWTEFPLACNNYPDDPTYLTVLEQESEAIIKRIRKHASNALWSGGNELFNAWSGMTDQSLALRLLNSQCYRLDSQTPFIPTSPLMGMAHGNYLFKNPATGEEVFQWMPHSRATAYTEFGMPGAASVEKLKQIIPENELFPPRPGSSWESHHAFHAWMEDTWLMTDLLKEYFGEAQDLETLVHNSQWLQGEGYKCIYEEARRQKPMCSMALNWCYNEPWITAANNSLISYPNDPKPAFYEVSNACRPFLASARIPKFSWTGGETFSCDVFILNDLYENIPAGQVSVKIRLGEEILELLTWDFDRAEPNQNIAGPTARVVLPNVNADHLDLLVDVMDKPEYSSSYKLIYMPGKTVLSDEKKTRRLNE